MALMGPAGTISSTGKSLIFQPFLAAGDRQDIHTEREPGDDKQYRERKRGRKKGGAQSQRHTPFWLRRCHLISHSIPKSETYAIQGTDS